jgi:ribonuclease HI
MRKIYTKPVDFFFFVDGFTIGKNPSKVGGGYTITDYYGELVSRAIIQKPGFTNNDGELLGIAEAVKICPQEGIIISDSSVCIGWVLRGKTRRRKLKNGGGMVREDLLPKIEEAHKILEEKKLQLHWGPREHNLAGIYNEKFPVRAGA